MCSQSTERERTASNVGERHPDHFWPSFATLAIVANVREPWRTWAIAVSSSAGYPFKSGRRLHLESITANDPQMSRQGSQIASNF
jgi:hypothetical protein